MNDEQGKQYAGRPQVPPGYDYEFSPKKSELMVITSDIGGNRVISQVLQIDDKFSRVLWSRAQEETAEIEKQQKSELQKALDWQLAQIRESGIDASLNNVTRIGVFFSVLGILIDKRAFPQKTTVDVFIKSAISFLYGNEDPHKWFSKWGDIARGKLKPREMEYPIVKFDSTTSRRMFEVYKIKGLFGKKIGSLKTFDEILEAERDRLGKTRLSIKEQKTALAREKMYRHGRYIYTDFEKFSIGFNVKLYEDFLISENNELLARKNEPTFFDEINKEIDTALEDIASYKIAYELAYIVLSEVYEQRKMENLYISVEQIFHYLQEPKSNKTLYRQIKDGFHALRFLDYVFEDSQFLQENSEPVNNKNNRFTTGNFIYNYSEVTTEKGYLVGFQLDVNPKFVGCVQALIDTKKRPKADFRRGYHPFPTVSIGQTRKAGMSVSMLTNRLFSETGNDKLNDDVYKIITPAEPAGETLCDWAGLHHSKESRRWKDLLKTLGKVAIIDKMDPTLAALKNTKPSAGLKNTKIRLFIKKDIKAIDEQLKKNLY